MAQKGPQDVGKASLGVQDLAGFKLTVSDDTIAANARATLTCTTTNLSPIPLNGVKINPTVHAIGGGVLPAIVPADGTINLAPGETEETTFIVDNSANSTQAKFKCDLHVTGLPGLGVHFTRPLFEVP